MTEPRTPDAFLTGPSWVLWDGDGNVIAAGDELVIPLRWTADALIPLDTTAHAVTVTLPPDRGAVLVEDSSGRARVPGGLLIEWDSTGHARFSIARDGGGDGG